MAFTEARLIGRENPISLCGLESRAMKSSRAFEVPELADSTTGGGWLIQTFISSTCKYFRFLIDSPFDLQHASSIK